MYDFSGVRLIYVTPCGFNNNVSMDSKFKSFTLKYL